MRSACTNFAKFAGYNENCQDEISAVAWVHLSQELINHERIHTAQLLEMGIIGFYIWYSVEWLVRLVQRGSAYRRLSMEREAYENQRDLDYLKHRKHFAWRKYL